MQEFDVVIVGSGPGGYVGAIACAQLGMKTAIIERYKTLGGTCLNVGCIPSKAYLNSSERYFELLHKAAEHGIEVSSPRLNWKKMQERVAKVVETTCGGVDFLMKKNKITTFNGHASFTGPQTLVVGSEEIKGKNIIIATGSKPSSLPFIKIDKKRIITSTEALNLPEIPKRMIVIGGGVIGVELGSVYARLGTQVDIVEYADRLIPSMDSTMGKELAKVLKKDLKMNILTAHKVKAVEAKGNSGIVKADDSSGKEITLEADYVLVCVGRRPYTDNLSLDKAGVALNARGQIEVNDHLQTNVPHIYAIGDVVRGAMLAHKASEEGVFVAEILAGQKPHINYNLIPGVVYTSPEIASVGATEEELKAQGIPYKVGQFPMKALGRARASDALDGLVKILAHKESDEILGGHIMGIGAGEMIHEIVVAMEFRASAEDLARTSHAHPTFQEAIKEAALDAWKKKPLHL